MKRKSVRPKPHVFIEYSTPWVFYDTSWGQLLKSGALPWGFPQLVKSVANMTRGYTLVSTNASHFCFTYHLRRRIHVTLHLTSHARGGRTRVRAHQRRAHACMPFKFYVALWSLRHWRRSYNVPVCYPLLTCLLSCLCQSSSVVFLSFRRFICVLPMIIYGYFLANVD